MQRSLFLLLFLFAAHSLSAQRYTVIGTVFNHANEPLNKALVSGDMSNTTTNSAGAFVLKTEWLPMVLTIEHPQYPDFEYFVNLPLLGDDTVNVYIQVEDKRTELEEVTVSAAARVTWAYPKKHVHIIDFDLYGDGMLLLCKDKKEYLLRRVDASSKPLFDLPLRDHPKNFYRDCTGALHVVYTDSLYEIQVGSDSLTLVNAQSLDYARRTIQNCVSSVADKRIYGYWGNYQQSVDYYVVDTLNFRKRRLYQARDRKYLRQIEEYKQYLAQGGKSRKDRDMNDYMDLELRKEAALERQQREEALRLRPAYPPAFRLRDSIVVFDHLNDTAVVFGSDGKIARRYPIIYQYHRKFGYQLIVNEEETRIFARYNYNGMARLMEIDLNTGRIIGETRLEKHIYPFSIQVRGDYVYYLFHHYVDNSINYVYKQRL